MRKILLLKIVGSHWKEREIRLEVDKTTFVTLVKVFRKHEVKNTPFGSRQKMCLSL